ncbi:DUF429 domain-containing protein [Rhodococcus sp. SGAir0479]|uniref:DUF429 domain-containing protein n=1 Tax=Rhodococcus sp. SGAir0479 TaxID=2567884 RepID=UPI0010CCC475|nr:DUF429 domain-containing protein [Rhodococcus sp. SGAir0479]QCQ90504.1 DUF429 domain-containing protein [Rhodococcus sp. SGAir0479]
MRTVGIDLAAEPAKTAVATVDWGERSARVVGLQLGAADTDLVGAVIGADRCGIDAPFGWPDAFVDFVLAHHQRRPSRELALSNRAGRLPLVRRRTDRVVHEATGIVPLSVSADLIAHVALRCAGLLARLAVEGIDADRIDGTVVEAYPAAALQQWGLPFRGYKGTTNREKLAQLVVKFAEAAPYLDFGGFREACESSDDAFDAVVAAVIARAAAVGQTRLPDAADADVAGREGWIHLPAGPLPALV